MEFVLAESHDAPRDRHRSLTWHPFSETLSRKSIQNIHPDCNNSLRYNDADIEYMSQFFIKQENNATLLQQVFVCKIF